MAGTPVSKFRDFMETTGPLFLTGPEVIINEAVKRRYLWGELVQGKEKAIQGGTKIQETIMFDDGSTFQMYHPNDTFTWNNPQVLDTLAGDWRFALDHMSWTDQEIILNAGEDKSVEAQKAAYKRLKKSKEQRMATSMVNGFEDTLWESPFNNVNEMEAAAGKKVFSIPVFINENVISTADGFRGHRYPGWTTVAGINPTTEPLWTNQVVFYDPDVSANSAPISATFADYNVSATEDKVHDIYGLISAFDQMWLKLGYIAPMLYKEHFEADTLVRRQKIICSRLGMTEYQRALRDSNDRLIPVDDPAYTTPRYGGIPLQYASNLDTATLYGVDSLGATIVDSLAGRNAATAMHATQGGNEVSDTTIDKGARYYWINAEYLTCFIHAQRYMEKHEVRPHTNQPFTHVQPTDTWWNMLACSRQRHGLVGPRQSA